MNPRKSGAHSPEPSSYHLVRGVMPYKDPEVAHACNLASQRAHAKEINARHRAKRAADPEKARSYDLAYRHNNPDSIRRKRQRFKQQHPERSRADSAIRRARKAAAPVIDYTAAQWHEQQEVQDHRCSYCGKRRKGKLTQDHIIPLSKGGSHTASNIVGACRFCNTSKHDKAPPIPVQMNLLMLAPPQKRRAS